MKEFVSYFVNTFSVTFVQLVTISHLWSCIIHDERETSCNSVESRPSEAVAVASP